MIRLLKQDRLKFTKYMALLLMVLTIPFISYGQTDEGPVIDKIVAKVDNYIILLSDVERYA